MANCPNCGASLGPDLTRCRKCGSVIQPQPSNNPPTAEHQPVQVIIQTTGPTAPTGDPSMQGPPPVGTPVKSRLVAGLLGIFLGALGVHRFYLGYVRIGVIQLLLTLVGSWVTCGMGAIAAGIWGLVEGIMILTGSIDRDSDNRPLMD